MTKQTLIIVFSVFALASCQNNNSLDDDIYEPAKADEAIVAKDDTLGGLNRKTLDSSSKTVKIDSARIKQLEKSFSIEKDEFSQYNKTLYKPKSAPTSLLKNGIYCYITTKDIIPPTLRFRIQYFNENWIFFKSVQFSIDGKAYDYIPTDVETDSGDGYIWEWSDQDIYESDEHRKEVIHALANAKSAKMKLIGRQYYDVRTITQTEITSIKQTIELYKAMGGQF